jgi:hypothetical protein
MSKIAFDCVDVTGKLFTVTMMSDSQEIDEVVAATVQAYKRSGIEVISATRTEEMVIDVNLYAPAPRRELVPTSALQWLAGKGAAIVQGGAAFGGLCLSVVGFDGGFSALSLSRHLHRLAEVTPAVMHMIHLA